MKTQLPDNPCPQSHRFQNEAGFSMAELIVATTLLVVVTGAVFALMRDSLKVSTTTYEMTDAQESLRTAQEYINRDLVNTGDGLNSINRILVPQNFVTNYLAVNPVTDPATPNIVNLPLLQSDNDVPANTVIPGTNPATTVRANPLLTDRLSMLETDPNFTPIALPANAINSAGTTITISPADASRFSTGEVYFLTSSAGATFGTITSLGGIDTPTPILLFSGGDSLELNIPGDGGLINTVSAGGTLATSLCRMQIIHYFINSNGLLIRRAFGVRGAAYRDSVIAEHVLSLQFRYFLNLRGADGKILQPVSQLTSSTQQLAVRQAEVTVTTETPHVISTMVKQQLTMTTSTSVRNMQFRQAQQPTSGG
jgi:Tfp pilus assembly protein PilW